MSDVFQAIFDQLAKQAKMTRFEGKGIITLGELIDKLGTESHSSPVKVQWWSTLTNYGAVDSYRGYYSDLAIDNGDDREWTVAEVLADLNAADGKTFEGYKGGDYRMSGDTLVWVSGYGEYTGVGATGVEFIEGTVVITSADCEN